MNSDTDEIYHALSRIFRDVFDNDDITVTRTLTADDVPEWDSLNHIRLILAVQKGFHTSFSAAQVADLKNVGDLVDLIQTKVAAS